MVIKKCVVKLTKNEVIGEYTRNVDGDIEIYEKTEGNYTEIVAKISNITDSFVVTDTGEIVNINSVSDENFVVYPNCTLDSFLTSKNTYGATISYTESLTQIS